MKISKLFLGLVASLCALLGQAAPPTSGAYVSDPQSEYVQDQTSQGTSMASMIFCLIFNTRPDAMVNLGTYVAFIDESKCDSNKADASNSSSESSGSSTEYTRMRLTSTRASNTSAQIVKGHALISMGPGQDSYVYMHASGTEGPSDAAPNGVVTMNMSALLVSGGTKVMRGKISATTAGVQFSMNQGAENYVLYVQGNDSSGSGAMRIPDPSGGASPITFTFGYNSTTFCRAVDLNPAVCFDRSKANAKSSVWRYGVYDDGTGDRYDIAVPGFPVKNTSTNEYGFASYWGIWFPSTLSNGAALVSLDSLATNYTVVKTGGRLNKVQTVSSTLSDVAKIPFNFNPQATRTSLDTGGALSQGTNYEAYWDPDTSRFAITGQNTCGAGGCFKTQLNLTATKAEMKSAMTPSGGNSMGLRGWSQALGGNLFIPASTLDGTTAVVKYNVQTVVQPGDTTVPASLKCAMNCPTRNLLSADPLGEVYTAGTKWKGGGTLAGDVVTYTWDGDNYTLSDSVGALDNALLSGKTLPPESAFGIRTGALVDATGTAWDARGAMDCQGSTGTGTAFCDFKSNSDAISTYYVWENGTQSFQSATFLKKSDNTFVAFTAPQSATFDVPAESKYGEFGGAKMNLQFGGFGNLWGIPGKCFDPATNAPASCSASTRYVPAFSIPENSASSQLGKVTIGGATKWVKYLDREIRFNKSGVDGVSGYTKPADITMGTAASLPTAMVLSGDAEDPSDSANTDYYAGAITADDFKAAPSVIHGVVQ